MDSPLCMEEFIAALMRREAYSHTTDAIELIETHISWVLLTGEYAYKIKKPVRFDFADFSSLERRRFFCMEELRLNRRFSAELYLDLVAVVGPPAQARIVPLAAAADQNILDYAVQMRQFEGGACLDRIEAQTGLTAEQVDAIAESCARFHDHAEISPADSAYASLESISRFARANFDAVRGMAPSHSEMLRRLESWTETQLQWRSADFAERKRSGAIRECHGDLHLANMTLYQGQPRFFDCIEFSAELRWIDTACEIAFTIMDFCARGRPDHGWRFANRYFELRDDLGALRTLRFYLCYRAMVRALVQALRLRQPESEEEAAQTRTALIEYIELADRLAHSARPMLILTCGLSGSGKSRATRELFASGIIRLRSDVERKRLFGLAPEESSKSETGAGIYQREASDRTYRRLLELAEFSLSEGYPTVVDATFLEEERRTPFRNLALARNIDFAILHCQASAETLRQRVHRRMQKQGVASEADLAVLESQLARGYRFTAEEQKAVIELNTEDEADRARTLQTLRDRIAAAGAGAGA